MSIFGDNVTENADTLRRDRLGFPSPILASLQGLSDEFLHAQLLAAEADTERALRAYLTPTEVLPDGATDAEKSALDQAGTRWVEEPGYDLEPDMFLAGNWFYLVLRHTPVISIHSIKFAFPSATSTIWDVPAGWIRLDKKAGHVRIVPGTLMSSAPISTWIMQMLSMGRNVPQVIQVRYKSGLENIQSEYPDLLDLVAKSAIVRIADDSFVPGSGSISADGLSRSISLDMKEIRAQIDRRMDRLRDAIHGMRMIVA